MRSTPTHRTQRPRSTKKKVVHKRPAHSARQQAAAKPVKVTFAPFPSLASTAIADVTLSSGRDDRDRYLWLAGLAFAVLAAAGLSLHVLSVRALT